MNNVMIASHLGAYAQRLERERSNLYRIRAYRRGADVVRSLRQPLSEVYAHSGVGGVQAIPGIGAHLAYTIGELLRTGQFRTWPERRRNCLAANVASPLLVG